MGVKGFLKTLALGAGVMYLLDPELGEQRRVQIRAQMSDWQREVQDLWAEGTRDLQDRAHGVQSRVNSMVTGEKAGTPAEFLSEFKTSEEMAAGNRLLALGGGGLLALFGLLRGGISGKVITLAGINYLTRGLTNRGLSALLQQAQGGGSITSHFNVHTSMVHSSMQDAVTDASVDSFPASDPPGWIARSN